MTVIVETEIEEMGKKRTGAVRRPTRASRPERPNPPQRLDGGGRTVGVRAANIERPETAEVATRIAEQYREVVGQEPVMVRQGQDLVLAPDERTARRMLAQQQRLAGPPGQVTFTSVSELDRLESEAGPVPVPGPATARPPFSDADSLPGRIVLAPAGSPVQSVATGGYRDANIWRGRAQATLRDPEFLGTIRRWHEHENQGPPVMSNGARCMTGGRCLESAAVGVVDALEDAPPHYVTEGIASVLYQAALGFPEGRAVAEMHPPPPRSGFVFLERSVPMAFNAPDHSASLGYVRYLAWETVLTVPRMVLEAAGIDTGSRGIATANDPGTENFTMTPEAMVAAGVEGFATPWLFVVVGVDMTATMAENGRPVRPVPDRMFLPVGFHWLSWRVPAAATAVADHIGTTPDGATLPPRVPWAYTLLHVLWEFERQRITLAPSQRDPGPSRAERRRLEREGRPHKALPDVRVVILRRPERSSANPDRPDWEEGGEAREVHWTCRWTVTGHWRKLAKSGRLVWVRPHEKGPDGLPLKGRTRVLYGVAR